MANPELGAKQVCPACSTKFYDLTRRPAVCPKCGTEFDPEEALRNRRVRARAPLPEDDRVEEKVQAPEEVEEGYEEPEAEEAPELDEGVPNEPVETEEDADGDGGPTTSDDALGVDFSEDEELAEGEDDEVPFLEEEDEDFPEDEIDGLPDEGDRDD